MSKRVDVGIRALVNSAAASFPAEGMYHVASSTQQRFSSALSQAGETSAETHIFLKAKSKSERRLLWT